MACVYGGVKLSKNLLLYDTCHPFKRGVMVTSLEGVSKSVFIKITTTGHTILHLDKLIKKKELPILTLSSSTCRRLTH